MEQSLFDGSGAPVPDPDPARRKSNYILEQNFGKKTLPNQWWILLSPSPTISSRLQHHLIVLVDHFFPTWKQDFENVGEMDSSIPKLVHSWFSLRSILFDGFPGTQSFTIGKAARGTWREWQPAYWHVRYLMLQKYHLSPTWLILINEYPLKSNNYYTWKLMTWKMIPFLLIKWSLNSGDIRSIPRPMGQPPAGEAGPDNPQLGSEFIER